MGGSQGVLWEDDEEQGPDLAKAGFILAAAGVGFGIAVLVILLLMAGLLLPAPSAAELLLGLPVGLFIGVIAGRMALNELRKRPLRLTTDGFVFAREPEPVPWDDVSELSVGEIVPGWTVVRLRRRGKEEDLDVKDPGGLVRCLAMRFPSKCGESLKQRAETFPKADAEGFLKEARRKRSIELGSFAVFILLIGGILNLPFGLLIGRHLAGGTVDFGFVAVILLPTFGFDVGLAYILAGYWRAAVKYGIPLNASPTGEGVKVGPLRFTPISLPRELSFRWGAFKEFRMRGTQAEFSPHVLAELAGGPRLLLPVWAWESFRTSPGVHEDTDLLLNSIPTSGVPCVKFPNPTPGAGLLLALILACAIGVGLVL